MQQLYQGIKAGVQDSPKRGGKEGPLTGVPMRLGTWKTCWAWGKQQHLYNTYPPIPSFLFSKDSL